MQFAPVRLGLFAAFAALRLAAQPPASKPPVTLPAEHKLFSPTIAQSLGKLQINQTAARQPLTLPPSVATARAFTLANQTESRGILECGPNKANDKMTAEESSGHLVLSITCQSAGLRTQSSRTAPRAAMGSHTLWIGFDKAAVPVLFKPATGVVTPNKLTFTARRELLIPGGRPAPIAAPRQSKDEQEVDNCVKSFQTYKNDPRMNYFRVVFVSRVYHCEVARSAEAFNAHRLYQRSASRTGLNVNGISPLSAPSIYFQDSDFVPDQHPPERYSYWREAHLTYNSKPDPNAAPVKGGLDLSKVVKPKTLDLAFATDRQPPWSSAMVQIVYALPPSKQTQELMRVDPCENWSKPANLLWSAAISPVYRNTIPGLILGPVTPVSQSKLTGVVSVPQDQFESLAAKISKDGSNARMFARIVPVAAGNACAAAPSDWLNVFVHDNYPAEKAAYDIQQALEKERLSITGPDGKLGSPITASIGGYVGYNLDLPDSPFMSPLPMVLGQTVISSDTLNGWGIKHSGGDWRACSFGVGDVMGWRHTDHSDLDSFFEKAWDDIVMAVDGFAGMITMMESFLAEAIVYGVTGGNCPFDDPTGQTPPAAGESDACKQAKKYTEIAIQVAVAVVAGGGGGLTASQLINQGVEAAASEAAAGFEGVSADVLSSVATEYGIQGAAQMAANALIQQLSDLAVKKIEGTVSCGNPDDSAVLYPHAALEQQYTDSRCLYQTGIGVGVPGASNCQKLGQQFQDLASRDPGFAASIARYPPGTYGFNEKHCLVAMSDPGTWGIANPAVLPSPGIVYLQVARNSSPQAANTSRIDDNKVVRLYISDRSGWYQDTWVMLDLARIPTSGMRVPVVLTPNLDKFRAQAMADGETLGNVIDVDAENGFWVSGKNKPGAKAEFSITSTYTWAPGNREKVVWADQSFDMTSIVNVTLPPSPPPCPFCDGHGDNSARSCNQ